MKTIELKNIGRFLTGRRKACEAVREIQPDSQDNIIVDFNGIESMAQSFISELLVSLYKHDIELSNIKFANYENDHVANRVET